MELGSVVQSLASSAALPPIAAPVGPDEGWSGDQCAALPPSDCTPCRRGGGASTMSDSLLACSFQAGGASVQPIGDCALQFVIVRVHLHGRAGNCLIFCGKLEQEVPRSGICGARGFDAKG